MYLYRYDAFTYLILIPVSINTITWYYPTNDDQYRYLYRYDALSYLILSPISNNTITRYYPTYDDHYMY